MQFHRSKWLAVSGLALAVAGCSAPKQQEPLNVMSPPPTPTKERRFINAVKEPVSFEGVKSFIEGSFGVADAKNFVSPTVIVFSPDAGGGPELMEAQFHRASLIEKRFGALRVLHEGMCGAFGSPQYQAHGDMYKKLIHCDPQALDQRLTGAYGVRAQHEDPYPDIISRYPDLAQKVEGIEVDNATALNVYGTVGGQVLTWLSRMVQSAEDSGDAFPIGVISGGKTRWIDAILLQKNLEAHAKSDGIEGFPHLDLAQFKKVPLDGGDTAIVVSADNCAGIHEKYTKQFMDWFFKGPVQGRTDAWWKRMGASINSSKPQVLFVSVGSMHVTGGSGFRGATLIDLCRKEKVSFVVATPLGD